MPKRYTDQQREDTLQHLDDNYGNVTLTALQTNIPARTIYQWKRERKLRRQQAEPPLLHKKSDALPQKSAANTDHIEDEPQGEYTRLRTRLMQHIDTIVETLTDDPDTAHIRAMALTRLLDRVIKLEALTRTEQPEQVLRVEYLYPDGSIHDIPPWQKPDTDDPFTPTGGLIPKRPRETDPTPPSTD